MPTDAEAAAETIEPMEQVPDTGIYEAPPVPFEEPRLPASFEHQGGPIPAPQTSTFDPQVPPQVIEETRQSAPATAAADPVTPEPPGAPPDAERSEF